MSGIVSLLGYPGGAPQMMPFPACDHVGGMLVAYAIMTALFVRERTGTGQEIDVNNLNAALYLQFSAFRGIPGRWRNAVQNGEKLRRSAFRPVPR